MEKMITIDYEYFKRLEKLEERFNKLKDGAVHCFTEPSYNENELIGWDVQFIDRDDDLLLQKIKHLQKLLNEANEKLDDIERKSWW